MAIAGERSARTWHRRVTLSQRSRRRLRRAVAVASLPLVSAAMIAATPGVASAQTFYFLGGTTTAALLKSRPTTAAANGGVAYPGQALCVTSDYAKSVGGIRWLLVADLSTHINGWVDAQYVYRGSARCQYP